MRRQLTERELRALTRKTNKSISKLLEKIARVLERVCKDLEASMKKDGWK